MRVIVLLAGCFWFVYGKVEVAVAANMAPCLKQIASQYTHATHEKVGIHVASSGKLAAQILRGAPYDIFMSANVDFATRVAKQKMLKAPVVYAKGKLALLVRNTPAQNGSLLLLKDKKVAKIAMANPRTAPYGAAAKEALEKQNIYLDIKHKFVYGESIGQTLNLALHGCDAGIVALPSLKNLKLPQGYSYFQVDDALYHPIAQAMVEISHSRSSKAFFDYLQSSEAKQTMRLYGYEVR